MQISNIENIKPLQDRVLTNLIVEQFDENELIIEDKSAEKSGDQAKMYFGEVLSMGPDSTDDDHCPGLKVGQTIFFSEFAGNHVSVIDSTKLVKIIRGYDIMAIVKDIKNITKDTVTPSADRIMIAAYFRDANEDGLQLSDEGAKDPKLKDLDYGVILAVGPTCKSDLKVGDIVAYDNYVGECLERHPEEGIAEYRIMNELDAIFTL